ncbi:unnamed protein product [Closterium sp. NIES-53]
MPSCSTCAACTACPTCSSGTSCAPSPHCVYEWSSCVDDLPPTSAMPDPADAEKCHAVAEEFAGFVGYVEDEEAKVDGEETEVAVDGDATGAGVGGGDGDDDCPYWGRPDNSWWDQSAVGEDDDVEYWSRDGLPEHLPIPTYPPRSKKRPHPSTKKQDAHPLSPRFRKNTRKHHAYTVGEKVKWVLRLEAVDNVSEVARESGIYRECLTEWKRQYDDLNKVAACRKRLHGHGRASWYPDMEAVLYSRS